MSRSAQHSGPAGRPADPERPGLAGGPAEPVEQGSSDVAVAEDLAPGLERLFSFVPEEHSCAVREVRGTLPAWLRGTCYWNGPARFQRGGLRYRPTTPVGKK